MGQGSEHRRRRNSDHPDNRKDSGRSSDSHSTNTRRKTDLHHKKESTDSHISEKYDSVQSTPREIRQSLNVEKEKLKNDNIDISSGLSSQMTWDERPDVDNLIMAILSVVNYLDSEDKSAYKDESTLLECILKNKIKIASLINSIPCETPSPAPSDSTQACASDISSMSEELANAKLDRSQKSVYNSFAESILKLDTAENISNKLAARNETIDKIKSKSEGLREALRSLHHSIHSTRMTLSSIEL